MRKRSLVALGLILSACRPQPAPLAMGTLERDRIELIAERQEEIVSIAVREGDPVEPGDVVVVLDPRRAGAQLAAAEAARALAAARLAEVVRGARSEEIAEARANLEAARSALIAVRPDLDRARQLVTDGIAPRSALDAAEAEFTNAEARVAAADATLEKALNGSTVEELNQAEAELKRSEAMVEELRLTLERLVVRAPRRAQVDAFPFEIGEQPPVGATVAVLLAEQTPYARVYIPASIRPQVVPGAAAVIRVEGVDGIFNGRVRTVSREATFTPYFALTERDRGRLAYLAEIDLVSEDAADLPVGLPVEVEF
jgi:HlyD family secretion protein